MKVGKDGSQVQNLRYQRCPNPRRTQSQNPHPCKNRKDGPPGTSTPTPKTVSKPETTSAPTTKATAGLKLGRNLGPQLTGRIGACQKAAVEDQRLAGDERRAIGQQPHHGFGDFVGLAEASEGMETKNEFVEGGLGKGSVSHGRLDYGGAYGVDADSVMGVFERGSFCEANDAVFAGDIGGGPG